ncbi:MAG: hypothetical protein PHW00_05770 [Clostridia bacterium]|nr:hypothetical protein [Clostridia bacterium]
MNSKKTLVLVIIYALIIVAGVVSICVANIGGIGFGDITTLTIVNQYQMTFDEFDEYIDTTLVEHINNEHIKVENRQIVYDVVDHYSIVVYDFHNLTAEEQSKLDTVLTAQSGNMTYNFTKSLSDLSNKALYMTAIIVGVVLILQFIYFAIFNKSTGRISTAVVSTITLMINIIVSSAVICLLGLVGIKVTAHAIASPLIVAFLTVVVNVVLFDVTAQIMTKSAKPAQEVLTDALAEIKVPMLYATLIGMVACVLLAAVGSYSMLSLTLAVFFGIMAVLCTTMYIAQPLLARLRK